jgi:hypothetical protein
MMYVPCLCAGGVAPCMQTKVYTDFLLILIDSIILNLGHIAFICDRRSGIYHTVKQFLAKEHLMMVMYGRNML